MKKLPLLAAMIITTACSFQEQPIVDEAHTPINQPIVSISHGQLQGSTDNMGIKSFLGIPYADTTSGMNRWQPPQPLEAWNGVKLANAFGDICPQPSPVPFGPWSAEFIAVGKMSENCLSLNVWTPNTQAENLPVFVWIHGGGFSSGSSDVPVYKGYSLAQKDIVVVSMNYRLGILGFLASSTLQEENGHAGEYGMLDQIAALKWVQNNIASFGGNPSNVTIGGQSAGAAAVQNLLKSPLADGLYQKAIIQSGIGLGALSANLDKAIEQGDLFIESSGAENLESLRAMNPNELIAMAGKFRLPGASRAPRFSPPTGNSFEINFRNTNIPVLTGLTANENSTFRRMTELDENGYNEFMQDNFADFAEQFKEIYKKESLSYLETAQAVMRDKGIASMAFRLEMIDSPKLAYTYLFKQQPPGEPKGYASFHSAELPFMFGTLQEGERPYSDNDHSVSNAMVDYWTTFMKDSNSLQNWPQYSPDQRNMMVFGGERLSQVTSVMAPEKLTLYRKFKEQGGSVGMLSL